MKERKSLAIPKNNLMLFAAELETLVKKEQTTLCGNCQSFDNYRYSLGRLHALNDIIYLINEKGAKL